MMCMKYLLFCDVMQHSLVVSWMKYCIICMNVYIDDYLYNEQLEPSTYNLGLK
jgi:hypothetical protein